MSQLVEQCGGELLIAEDLNPLGEGEVGGDNGGPALVAVGEEIEEELAAGAVEGDEAGIVDDEEGSAFDLAVEAKPSSRAPLASRRSRTRSARAKSTGFS